MRRAIAIAWMIAAIALGAALGWLAQPSMQHCVKIADAIPLYGRGCK